jgi:hypothetical protein
MPGLRVPGGFLRRHRTAVASWAALSVAATSLVAYAVSSKGFPAHEADLNDGGVWVTNQQIGAIGRQNVPIGQLDSLAWAGKQVTAVAGLDVLQNGAAVVSYDPAGILTPIDVTQGATVPDQQVSIKGRPAMGGSVVSVVDPESGAVWATHVDPASGQGSLSGVSGDAKKLATVGGDAAGTVAEDGTVLAVSAAKGTVTTVRALDGSFAKPRRSTLSTRPSGGIAALAAIGDTPVVLDKTGRVLAGDKAIRIGEDAQLQQDGPARDEVLVATADALEAVTLADGHRRVVSKAEWGEEPGRPVRLGHCDWQVWSTSGSAHVVTACDGADPTVAEVPDVGPSPEMVFRVNRNQIVLNDVVSGTVWRIDGKTAEKISDWDALQKTQDDQQQADPNPDQQAKQTPPIANPDDLGVRNGRTTVLHVLDNDRAAVQAILAVTAVDTRALPDGVSVQIAPDRQSLLATAAASAVSGDYTFGYTVDDGSGSAKSTDDGKVTLHVRTDSDAGKPVLRDGYTEGQYFTVGGGNVEIPVAPDWRDPAYGDPVAISDVKVDQGGSASVTPQGLLKFVAPPEVTGRVTSRISYTVSTGGDTATGSVRVTMLPDGLETQPAQAQPDAAAGQVGGTIVIHPLDNDIPGADPGTPDARLALAGNVAPVRGQPVETDRVAGTVTMRPTQPGTYYLSYGAAFGNAKTANAQIRVIVDPAKGDATIPVAGPDTATVRGQSPTTVDVLANDYDPKGGVLVVTAAEPTAADSSLEVAIVDGRWLRVSADDPAMVPAVQAIEYTVSNGSAEAKGSLTVTQDKPLDPDQNAPVTEPDNATVRAGGAIEIPVLDNDSTPSGDPVGLAPAPATDANPAGRYVVLGDPLRDLGKAYLAGRRVRYVAPKDDGKGPLDVRIEYAAINSGEPLAPSTAGQVSVHVTPLPKKPEDDKAPTPRALEGRVVQGDTVTLHLPPTGLDPDGDAVNIVSVGDVDHGAPTLGRITELTGGGISYQAFPGVSGTDQFSYVVQDSFGLQAVGIARVAVVQPGPPQPPVALDDLVLADQGREVVVDVLANDLRTPGTRLTLEPLQDPPAGVSLDEKTGLITVKASSENNDVVEVPYGATNGIDASRAVLRVRTQKGYDNAPVADDVLATPEVGAATVTVDVLAHVSDIDDATSDLEVGPVTGAKAVSTGKLEIPVTDAEQILPYEVTDPQGAVAAAVIRVPARPSGTPYLKPDAAITLDPGATVTKDLSDLVADPEGDDVVLTTLDAKALYGAPAGALQVTASATALKITAGKNAGPASVTFTVSDRPTLADTKAHVVTLSVPVQIGSTKPVVTCPGEPLTVAEGGRDLMIDVASVCHVWTDPPSAARTLSYEGSWSKQLAGVSLDNAGGKIRLRTGTDARAGSRGEIAVGVAGQPATATLNVLVTTLPPPSLTTVNVDGHAGKPKTIDLRKYLRTKVAPDALDVQVMSVTPLGSPTAPTKTKGSVLTVTPRPDTSGLMRFRVEVSDLGTKSTRPHAVGEVRVAVAARPDAPSGLVAGNDMLSNTVVLSWHAPNANGARITSYVVKYSSSKKSGEYPCTASPCRVTGLPNGVPYTFSVKAVNAEGESDWSNTASAQPDDVTGPVLGLAVKLQRDHSVTLTWDKPATTDASDAKTYRVTWPGGAWEGAETEHVANVAANGQDYTFTVTPVNDKGPGSPTTVVAMGAGKPDAPAKPTFDLQDRPGNRKAVVVKWGPVDPNGPSPVQYQVVRQDRAGSPICAWQTATSCADDLPLDGATYTYTVQARNAEETSPRESGTPGFHLSAVSPPGTVESASTPDPMSIGSYVATGNNQEVKVSFTTGASHGSTNRVECTINGATCAGSPWTYPVTGASDTKTLATSVANGSTATIKLRACNGSSGSAQTGATCSAYVQASTTPYDDIGTPSISVSPSGDHIVGSASWNANGKPVNVRITRNGSTIYSANGVGTGSTSINDGIGYSQTGNYVITVSDTALWPGQTSPRATKTASDSATTPPPPATITVSRGTRCGGGGGSACDPGVSGGTCSNASCGYVHIRLTGFPSGSVTCRAYSDGPGGNWTYAPSVTVSGGVYDGEPGWWYGWPNTHVWVTCGSTTSPKYLWPSN